MLLAFTDYKSMNGSVLTMPVLILYAFMKYLQYTVKQESLANKKRSQFSTKELHATNHRLRYGNLPTVISKRSNCPSSSGPLHSLSMTWWCSSPLEVLVANAVGGRRTSFPQGTITFTYLHTCLLINCPPEEWEAELTLVYSIRG